MAWIDTMDANVNMKTQFIQTYISVDCVVFGFDGQSLNVLLVRRYPEKVDGLDLKLPGSLIYQDEDADTAAHRVLKDLTGINKMTLKQFNSFTSPQRTSNPEDIEWLKFEYNNKIDRIVTVSYLSLCKIDRKLNVVSKYKTVQWCPVDELPKMPFDHNLIVEDSLKEIRRWLEYEPSVVFELLPSKFTAAQLRRLYEAVYRKSYDVRNFHKKIAGMDYIVLTNEWESGVSHRAARFYKFDKILYKKRMAAIE